MAEYFGLLCVCIVHRAEGYCVKGNVVGHVVYHMTHNIPLNMVSFRTVHNTHPQQAKICRHNTDNTDNDRHIGTSYVILTKH